MFYSRNSLFLNNKSNSYVNEAEDDDTAIDNAAPEPDNDDTSDSNTNNSEESDNSNDNESDDGDNGDDMNIDANLGDESGDDDMTGGDDGESDTSSVSSPEETEEEPVQANTDIFADLSKEEQAVKIEELKKLYSELYSSVDDFIKKLNDIVPDENNVGVIKRCSNTLYSLKNYISDYLLNLFPIRSYIENDIEFNRFLTILNSVANVISDITKAKEN